LGMNVRLRDGSGKAAGDSLYGKWGVAKSIRWEKKGKGMGPKE